jgi:hypothetical protein
MLEAIGARTATSKDWGIKMRKLKQVASVVMFVALFDAVVNQVLFWTTEEYHTQAIATRIGNASLLALASLVLLTTIWNYNAIKKENA